MPLLLLLALVPAPAASQAAREEDALEVTLAALRYVRDSLPAGRPALDPEIACEARLIGWNCPEPFRAAADSLGFRLGGRAFTLLCLGGPRSCRLVEAESLVVLEPPEIDRGRATQEASVWWRPGSRSRSILQRGFRMTLERTRSGWEVVREEAVPPRQEPVAIPSPSG
jgi:hypothetical protein